MADSTQAPASGAPQASETGASAGSQAATGESGSESNGRAPADSGTTSASPASYRDKVNAARAKVAEAPKADPKASAPTDSSTASAGDRSPATPAESKSSDDYTERTAELARAARNTREEAAKLKREREALAAEKAEAAKEREEVTSLREVKKLLSEGKIADAWAAMAGDKASDIEVFTEIANRVAGSDSTPLTPAEMRKEVRAAIKETEEEKEAAANKAKAAEKEKQDAEYAAAEKGYYESDDPKDLGVIPLFERDRAKYPAINARGADRAYMNKVFQEMTKDGKGPSPKELLAGLNERLQAKIDKEAKALGYAKPEAKKPPAAQSGRGGSPLPLGETRKPGESAYAARLREAKARFRGEA
jgi:hypothetical protein